MSIEEIYKLTDEISAIKKIVGKVRMDLAVDWTRMATADLDDINTALNMIRQRIILEKTIEVLTNPLVEI